MGVASAEKFLHWMNAFCVLLLLPGEKPGCAQRNRMSYFEIQEGRCQRWLCFKVKREHKASYKLTTKSEYIK